MRRGQATRTRRLADLPSAEAFAAEPCPLTRFATLTEWARDCGTLPSDHAELRRRSLPQALRAGYRICDVARRATLSRRRIYQLRGPLEAAA